MTVVYDFTGAVDDPLPAEFTNRNGTMKIGTENSAKQATFGAYPTAMSTVESQSDGTVSALIKCGAENLGVRPSGLALRWVDNDNYLNIAVNPIDGEVFFLRRTSGGFIDMAAAHTIASFDTNYSYKLAAVMLADSVDIYLEDALIASLSETQGQTSIHHGMHTFSKVGTFDDFTAPSPSVTVVDSINCDLYNNQLFHSSSGSTRSITVTGTYTAETGEPSISYKLDGGAAAVGEATPTGGTYSFVIPALAVAHYDLEVFFTAIPATTVTKTRITVAPAFHGTGQSNMECVGTNNQALIPNGSNTAILLGFDYVYKEFVDPWSDHTNQVDGRSFNAVTIGGSWLTHFANNYLAAKNEPLGLVPNAKGSESTEKWQKTNSTRVDGLNLYECLTKRITETDGVEFVLYQGCESDLIEDRATAATKILLNQFIDDVFADFGVKTWIVPMYTYKSDVFDGDGVTYSQTQYRAMQIEVAAENANAEIVQSLADLDILVGAADDTGDNDGVHAYTDGALTTVGQRVYQSIYGVVVAPQGTVTIGNISAQENSASVPFNYSDTDQTGFEYQVDNGAITNGTSPISITGLTASTTYAIKVRAVNATGVGDWSTSSSFTTSAIVVTPTVSTFNLVDTDTPNGTYLTDFYNDVNKTLIETKNITFSNGSASTTLEVSVGNAVHSLHKGSNPPVTGIACVGVTQ